MCLTINKGESPLIYRTKKPILVYKELQKNNISGVMCFKYKRNVLYETNFKRGRYRPEEVMEFSYGFHSFIDKEQYRFFILCNSFFIIPKGTLVILGNYNDYSVKNILSEKIIFGGRLDSGVMRVYDFFKYKKALKDCVTLKDLKRYLINEDWPEFFNIFEPTPFTDHLPIDYIENDDCKQKFEAMYKLQKAEADLEK